MNVRDLAVAALRKALLLARPAILLDRRGYCRDPADNLLPGLDLFAIADELSAGAGGELAGKFCAPHSSAALVANCLAPLRVADRCAPLAGGNAAVSGFEVKLPTGLPAAQPPHLDALALGPAGVVAIESKCLEPLTPGRLAFSPRYRLLAERQRRSRWFDEMIRLENGSPVSYRHLDAAQLIKHAFGLIATGRGEATLLYLFWEPADATDWPVFAVHRAEVAAFAARVADDPLRFAALSYPELWCIWAARADPWLDQHVAALRHRYGVRLERIPFA